MRNGRHIGILRRYVVRNKRHIRRIRRYVVKIRMPYQTLTGDINLISLSLF